MEAKALDQKETDVSVVKYFKPKPGETKLHFWVSWLFKSFAIIMVVVGVINIILFSQGIIHSAPFLHEVTGTTNYEGSQLYVALGYVSVTVAILGSVGIFIGNLYNLDLDHKFFIYFSIYVVASLINSAILNAWWMFMTLWIQWGFFYIRFKTWRKINKEANISESDEKIEEQNFKYTMFGNIPSKNMSIMNKKWWTIVVVFVSLYFLTGVLLLVPGIFDGVGSATYYTDIVIPVDVDLPDINNIGDLNINLTEAQKLFILSVLNNSSLVDPGFIIENMDMINKVGVGNNVITVQLDKGVIFDPYPWLDVVSSSLMLAGVLLVTRRYTFGWMFYIASSILVIVLFYKLESWTMMIQSILIVIATIVLFIGWSQSQYKIKNDYKKFLSLPSLLKSEDINMSNVDGNEIESNYNVKTNDITRPKYFNQINIKYEIKEKDKDEYHLNYSIVTSDVNEYLSRNNGKANILLNAFDATDNNKSYVLKLEFVGNSVSELTKGTIKLSKKTKFKKDTQIKLMILGSARNELAYEYIKNAQKEAIENT